MFYQRLRDLREDKDINQKKVSEILNLAEKTYQRYERGENDIPLEKAIILAKYYSVSLDYIAGLTNDKRGLTKDSIPEEEAKILKKIKKLSDIEKAKIEERIDMMIEQAEEEAKLKGAI